MASARYPLISPTLRAREKIRRTEDLLRLTLFRDETDDAWPEWFAEAGLGSSDLPPGPTYPTVSSRRRWLNNTRACRSPMTRVVRGTISSGPAGASLLMSRPGRWRSTRSPAETRVDEPMIAAFRNCVTGGGRGGGGRAGVSPNRAAE